METKIIKILWEGKEAEVEIKRFTFGEKNDIQDYAIDTKIVGNTPQMKLSQKKLKEMTLVQGIKSAPFRIDLTSIQDLPDEIGVKLFEEIDKLNTVTSEKKESLSGPSCKEQLTQN